jgi:hypothetical protein
MSTPLELAARPQRITISPRPHPNPPPRAGEAWEGAMRREGEQRPVPRASEALDNLRGFVILLVLSFHSVLAYLNFLPASPFPFDLAPYL